MMSRRLLGVVLCFVVFNVNAFTCYLTMVKDSCWGNYNVTVNIIDTTNNKTIGSVIVPAESDWARQKFTCQPGQELYFQAQFTPVFWASDEGKVYSALHYWNLPASVNPGDTAWNINLCYPKEFSGVPFPPEGTNHCVCDTSKIPPVPAQ